MQPFLTLQPKYLSFYCIITLVILMDFQFHSFLNNLDANDLTLFFCIVLTC